MDETLIASSTIAWLAFALGVVFGFVGNKTNFCTLGAISDAMNIGDWGRMRMWALAMAVAIFGASALQFAGLIDVHKSIYTGSRLLWLSHVVGGLLFGAGMTLASGCGSKTLIRIGTGNLKSLVVFAFLGIAAYMTLRGLFGTWRVAALDSVAIDLAGTQDLPAILARQAGMAADTAMMAAATVVGGALALFALEPRRMAERCPARWHGDRCGDRRRLVPLGPHRLRARASRHPRGGLHRHQQRPHGVLHLRCTLRLQPGAADVLERHQQDRDLRIAAALGVMAGSALFAAITRSFRLESFRDSSDLLRHRRRDHDGIRWRHGAGLHHWPGHFRHLDARHRLLDHHRSDHRGSALTMKIEYWRLMREA